MPQPRLTAADITTFFLAGILGIVAGNLTYLALFANNELVLQTLMLPLKPGLAAAFCLFGDAEGYIPITGFAPVLAVFVNAVAYAALALVPRLLWCHIARNQSLTGSLASAAATPR